MKPTTQLGIIGTAGRVCAICLSVAAFLLVPCLAATVSAPPHAAARPNVLVLFTDDQRADTIAALGNSHIKTPNLDRLVARGVSFSRAYMQGSFDGATCVPSRAMLMSGQGLFRLGNAGNLGLAKVETWPEAFGKAGYTTFVTGKWHNDVAAIPRGFQQARAIFPGGMGNPMNEPLKDMDGKGALGIARPHPGKHSCEVFADEAVRFIRQQPEGTPFFCYVPFNGPHDPHVVPPEFALRYDPADIPAPPDFLPRHPFDNGDLRVRDETLLPWPRTPDQVRTLLAEYYRYISYLDGLIGRVLDALDASPHGKNTLVVFASDSGAARGSHGLIGKQSCYQHSMRVPLVISGPGVAENRRSEAMCYLFDVLPTMGAMCGVKGPDASEGLEFSRVLQDPGSAHRSSIFLAYKPAHQRAIVTNGGWKLIRYPLVDKTQLFDLNADPHETADLSSLPDRKEKCDELLALMRAQQKAFGDPAPLVVNRKQQRK